MGCRSTVDSLGFDTTGGTGLKPVKGPTSYPNAFGDVLGKSDAEIQSKIDAAFMQLFHGGTDQTIYYPVGTDEAYIEDVLHGDIRTEGLGYGMFITVQLDKQDEFDRIWRFTKANFLISSGARGGYFYARCDLTNMGDLGPCDGADPFGMEQFVTSLIFAKDRWGTSTGTGDGVVDYGADAAALLSMMRHKEDLNGGVVDDVTNVFDPEQHLPVDQPTLSSAGIARPSVAMPAYYDIWAQATSDPFWSTTAAASRVYWEKSAHPMTGLLPLRSKFDGSGINGADILNPEGFRTHLNIALDRIWSPEPSSGAWESGECDRLLQFFTKKGIKTYGSSYSIDGTMVLNTKPDDSLVAVNGALGVSATVPAREDFIQAVWDMPVPTGTVRYYTGVLQLVSMLILSGQARIY
jgi:oligosaccharide reducing-end xylanase